MIKFILPSETQNTIVVMMNRDNPESILDVRLRNKAIWSQGANDGDTIVNQFILDLCISLRNVRVNTVIFREA